MSDPSAFRSRQIAEQLIGFSVSYQRENLLARGLGLEHLRELLLRLARPLLRHGGSLAYDGDWEETPENFTFDLLRLVSAERLDDTPAARVNIGQLFCYSPWPEYHAISKSVEAQWMNCCRILRINQARAGLAARQQVQVEDLDKRTPRLAFNAAVTASAMRNAAMAGWYLRAADLEQEFVPPITSRIAMAGSLSGYSGFAPDLFEEALLTLEARRPLYLLGGLGGAAEVLAKAILETRIPVELTLKWHLEHTPALRELGDSARRFGLPKGCRSSKALFDALAVQIRRARRDPAKVLNTGLNKAMTRELLLTRNVDTAVGLVLAGFVRHSKLPRIAV
ncbi:MAG: hypothetical protein AB7U95_08715 [Reyranella sp.]